MVRLPREVFRSAGQSYEIRIGHPIPCESLKGGRQAQGQADEIKEIVYRLG